MLYLLSWSHNLVGMEAGKLYLFIFKQLLCLCCNWCFHSRRSAMCSSQKDRPEGSISPYCIKTESICSLSTTFTPVVNDNPFDFGFLVSKCTSLHSLVSTDSSGICPWVWYAAPLCLILLTPKHADGSWKSTQLPFNNTGEDHIDLIYCLIQSQPLPSP